MLHVGVCARIWWASQETQQGRHLTSQLCRAALRCAVLCCVPQKHCYEAIAALRCISTHWWSQMLLLTTNESNAEVLAAGAVSFAHETG